MIIEDPTHLNLLFEKLLEKLGKPPKQISDLEIDFTSLLPKFGLKQALPEYLYKSSKPVA